MRSGVGVLDVAAGVLADALVVRAVGEHRVDDVQAVALAEPEVVLAEGDRRVHEARAVVGGDEVRQQHGVPALAPLAAGQERERRLVAHAVQRGAGEAFEDLHTLAEHALDERLREHDRRLQDARLHAHVRELGVDGDRRVRDQGPGRRGPDEQLVAALDRPAVLGHRHPHVERRVDDVLVAERHLVARQRRAAARAVGDDLVALVEQALVGDLLQRPPDRLDVRRVQRPVRAVEIDPEADALRQRLPVLEELEHRRAAALVELGDAVGLDLVLGGDAELLLDRQLDREAVGVPPAAALDELAPHRLVAGEDVLEDAAQDVVRAGAPVRGRRPLVEHVARRALATALGLVEDVALAPPREHGLLEAREVLLGIDGAHPVQSMKAG